MSIDVWLQKQKKPLLKEKTVDEEDVAIAGGLVIKYYSEILESASYLSGVVTSGYMQAL